MKRRHNIVRCFASAALIVVGLGCATRPPPKALYAAPKDGAPVVAVVKSSGNPVYDVPLASYVEQLKDVATLYVVEVEGTADDALEDLKLINPALVFSLGTKGTLVAKEAGLTSPILFAMVVNYSRHNLADQPNMMGVSLETPTFSEFAQFKMVAPKLARVLAFYAQKESQALVDDASKQLKGLGIELVAVPIEKKTDIEALYAEHAGAVDGVWLLNDPVVMNPDTFEYLREKSTADKLPFVSSLSDRFAHAGALMSVSVDFAALGSQAAAMTRMHLEQGQSPNELGVQPPISSQLVLNMKVARAIGLDVPPEVLPFINKVLHAEAVASPDAPSN